MTFSTAPVRGVVEHFGPRTTNSKFGSESTSKDNIKKVALTYDWNDLPNGSNGELDVKIPARAVILRAITEVLETGGGYTAVVVAAGSFSESETLGTAVGSFAVANTAASVGAADVPVTVTLTGSETAGRFKTTVEYLIQGA